MGVDKGGNTLCGPYLPLGVARPGPDTWPPVGTQTNGYSSDRRILRFSQNHVSGTGGESRYGNIAVTPFTGEPFPPLTGYNKADEHAEVGLYAVRLLPDDIRTEITATHRCGVYRFTFPRGAQANALIDAGAAIRCYCPPDSPPMPHSVGGFVEVVGDREVVGRGDIRGGWGHQFPYSVHFCARFDRPFSAASAFSGDFPLSDRVCAGPDSKAIVSFSDGGELNLVVAISYHSLANARASLDREAAGKPFDALRQAAVDAWEQVLGKLRITGGSEAQRKIFYTSLYRLFCMPSDLGVDDEFHLWKSGVRHFTDYYCLWDSARNANSLITLLDPKLEVDMLNCLLDVGAHTGWVPDAWIAGHSAHIQGGSSADALICEAALKGLQGIDYEKALLQMRKNNEVVSPDPYLYGRYLEDYRDLGYVSDKVKNCVSKHIEYAYQDCCIGRLAGQLGQQDVAEKFYQSSRKLWNLWHAEHRSFAPRKQSGEWVQPFDPRRSLRPDYWNDPYFYEGTGYEWSLCALQDIAGLIRRHGGPEAFVRHLDAFFGGLLYHMKEMILHTPMLYHYAGRPDRSADTARRFLDRYRPARDGLDGNEDMGAHSAYCICVMIGLYPVMGQDLYLLLPPVFDETVLRLGQTGKDLVLRARRTGAGKYIVGLKADGKAHERNWLTHAELLATGVLEFELADTPGNWGTGAVPPSPLGP
jgi:predicted alpha-1,2-mannosidase